VWSVFTFEMHTKPAVVTRTDRVDSRFPDQYMPAMPSDSLVVLGRYTVELLARY